MRPDNPASPGDFPPNLLVNADDFGLDPRISLAIARCAREGLIHSLSAVPFRDAFHADLLRQLLADCPDVKVGAHLCLVEFPYRLAEGAPVGPDGAPPADFKAFARLYLRGRMDPDWAYREWKTQIEALAERLGGAGRIAHLDSHQHLHLLPGLWGMARRLQKEFGIPRLRVPYESLTRSLFHRFPFGLAMQTLAALRRRAGGEGFIGFFTSTSFTLEGNRTALRNVSARPGTRFELMVHPALPVDGFDGHPHGTAYLSPNALPAPARDSAAREAAGRPGIDRPFRTRIRAGQEREIRELIRLRGFYRTQ